MCPPETKTVETCPCHEASKKSFKTVSDSVCGESDEIIANSDLLAEDEKTWMRLYRCRVCGMRWFQAWYSSGHVSIDYLYPAPPTDDPAWLLRIEAAKDTYRPWDERKG